MGGMLPHGLRLMRLVSCERTRHRVCIRARVSLSITLQLAHTPTQDMANETSNIRRSEASGMGVNVNP